MPSVMRVSPAPLYNSFTDVYNFVKTLIQIFQDLDGKFYEKCDIIMEGMTEDILSDEKMIRGKTDASSRDGSLPSSDSEPDSMNGSNTL